MMRIALSTMVLLLSANLCFAQGARNSSEATVRFEGKTTVANLAVTGLATTGNPGYIEFTPALDNLTFAGDLGSDTLPTYFLWVDKTGDLCISSHPTMIGNNYPRGQVEGATAFSSFPTGNWSGGDVNGQGLGCTVVGGQS